MKILHKHGLQKITQMVFKILQYLQEKIPFRDEENLINLASGEVADESVNMQQDFQIRDQLFHG